VSVDQKEHRTTSNVGEVHADQLEQSNTVLLQEKTELEEQVQELQAEVVDAEDVAREKDEQTQRILGEAQQIVRHEKRKAGGEEAGGRDKRARI